MKRLLVHLHLYYYDQIDYFLDKLNNINGIDWDLIVTYSAEKDVVFDKIRRSKPGVRFLRVKNIGYDIWPFIQVIKSVDLEKYDYIVKLHTKRSVRRCAANVIPMKGYEWRNALVDGVLFSPSYFSKVLKKIEEDSSIGMISNLKTYSKRNWESYSHWISKEMQRLGLCFEGNHFCMGTMFIARSGVFKPLQDTSITENLFKDTLEDSKRDFTSAHYYERMLSVLPSAFGLRHVVLSPRKRDFLWIKAVRVLEKPVRWMFGIEKKGEEKRKFIRILGFEFYIEPPKK